MLEGIADFSGGRYYDQFSSVDELTAEHREGLAQEEIGTRSRIHGYYLPLLRSMPQKVTRVLDAGCGNGLGVDLLLDAGLAAWGVDLSQLRQWQWREQRTHRDHLAVADVSRLPFADQAFDVVISSGVLEHVGVEETSVPRYRVTPLESKNDARLQMIRELARVLRPGGTLFLDFPNGAFPIDFWHGPPRFHSTREGFLPTVTEVEQLAQAVWASPRLEVLSPRGRLEFRQSRRRWYGRLFHLPVRLLFWLMEQPGLRWIARTGVNPYLVVRITTHSVGGRTF